MNQNRSATKKIGAGFVLLCATELAVGADQLSLDGGLGLELHDNAPLLAEKESDLLRIARADIGYKKPEGSLTADLVYRAERRDYLRNTQGDQNVIDGNAAFVWHIQPRLLDAVLYHQISQEVTDRRGLDVSSNREERSIITAGFDGFLHFSPVDSLVLSPRFADVNFQHSTQSNSQRATFAATWDHKLSALSALDLTGGYDHVTFDDSSRDYDSPNVMLAYHAALARLSYQAGVGYTRLNRDQGKDFNGSTVKAGVDYKGEEGLNAGAIFVHQLTDSSIGLSSLELSNTHFQSNDSSFEQPDTIEKDQFDVYLEQQFSVVSKLRFGAGYLKEDYKETPRDQKIAYGQLGYQYSLNSFWSIGADARFERTQFLDDPNDLRYNTTRLSLALIYKPIKPMDVRLSVGRDKRNASDSAFSYADKFVTIDVNYKFF